MRKYVIGFELANGSVEIDPQKSNHYRNLKELLRREYGGFVNVKIYKLIEVLK